MVRLVFRPYTQIRRTICTSVSLRASTRVSPGFTLFRHRSPSFGSQQICSYSNLSQVMIGRQCLRLTGFLPQQSEDRLYFHCASEFFTQILAQMLDSLVRVSRRVDDNHFVQDRDSTQSTPYSVLHFSTEIALRSERIIQQEHRTKPQAAHYSFLNPNRGRVERL